MNYFLVLSTLFSCLTLPLYSQDLAAGTAPKSEAVSKEDQISTNLKADEENQSTIKDYAAQLKAQKSQSGSDHHNYQIDSYPKSPTSYSYDELSEKMSEIEGVLSSAESEKNKISQQIAIDESRLQAIPKELGSAKAALSLLGTAQQIGIDLIADKLLHSKRLKLTSDISRLELESKLLEARIANQQDSLSSIEEIHSEIKNVFDTWNVALEAENRKRAVTIKKNAEKLMLQLADHPQLKSIAELNLQLVNQVLAENNVPTQIRAAEAKLAYFVSTLQSLEEQQSYAKERLKLLDKANMPIDRETGQLLRKQRANLPSDRDLKIELKSLFEKSTRNEVAILELKSERELLPKNIDSFLKNLSLKEGDGLPTKENAKELIQSCNSLYSTLLEQRKDLSTKQSTTIDLLQQTIVNSKDYTTFLDSRLLWIVSDPAISLGTLKSELLAVQQFISPPALQTWAKQLQQDWLDWYPLWISLIIAIAVLLKFRPQLKQLLSEQHEQASKRFCTSILPTIKALLLEVALQLPLPLIIGFIGWRSPAASELGHASFSFSVLLFITLLCRSLAKKKGFLVANFDLKEEKRKLIRRVLTVIIPIILPVCFFTQGILSSGNGDGSILTILNLIIMGSAMHLLLWPKKMLLAHKSAGFICYASYLFFAIFPFVLAIAAAVGYFVSVQTLRSQLIDSMRLVLIVMLVSAIITRWLLISKRSIASKTASESKNEAQDETPEGKRAHRQELRAKLEQITQVSDQSAKLIKVAVVAALFFGLTSIWANTMPALNVLDGQELWTTTSSQPVTTPENPLLLQSDAAPQTDSSGLAIVSVTLQDVLLSLVILVITYIAATNIPGLLKMTILDRLHLKTGAAFGVTTIVRYIIVIVGIVWAFNNISITWDKVQWIAAAVTLGIGFGLQEIFANFVAGLILLFERPVRIGDLVTIGGVNGKVSKIEMRATTILQFNNRELIVPNKEFITGQLVNWTLSDNIMRAEVVVGIAYGSDTELAKTLLLQCATENVRVLNGPTPDVIFSAFGASSLDFMIRVYVKSVDDLVPVQSELHFAIDNAFREANIEIAFPQQDIHIRSIEAALPIQKLNDTEENA